MKTALVIGAGPAGLMAADAISAAGYPVTVAEAKTSAARKFLMAGKSGLNLTKDEPVERFLQAYGPAEPYLRPMLSAFGPSEVKAWAQGLEQALFTGSTKRVFPKSMKGSPLLRNWLARLEGQGVLLRKQHRWVGLEEGYIFQTTEGTKTLSADVVVLACGGSSWARLGSDGAWIDFAGLPVSPIKPANMGFIVPWSPHMAKNFGKPVKGVRLMAGKTVGRGEFVISQRGLEGGGIYEISIAIRDGAPLTLDLLPDLSVEDIRARLSGPRGKDSLSNFLRKRLKLDPIKQALLMEFGWPLPDDLAPLLKALAVSHDGPRPLDEAISTAGGLRFEALDETLMVKERPGVFAAGEMLDWEAPTGGYLLTACFATGLWAGQSAVRWMSD